MALFKSVPAIFTKLSSKLRCACEWNGASLSFHQVGAAEMENPDWLERRVRSATVRVITNPESYSAVWGSGTLVRASTRTGPIDYILTNAHVVSIPTGKSRKLTGMRVDGEHYHPVFDRNGKPGIARLVAYNTGGVCTGLNNLFEGAEYRDMAVLQVVARDDDPVRYERLLRILSVERFASSEAVSPKNEPVRPVRYELLSSQPVRPSGEYVACGFPIDPANGQTGDMDCSRGQFSFSEVQDGSPDGHPRLIHLEYPAEGSRVRPGYSGGNVFSENGLPVGMYTGSGPKRASGVPIEPVVDKLRDIVAAARRGEYSAVGQVDTQACTASDYRWKGSRNVVQAEAGEAATARLKRAVAAFRDKESRPLLLDVSSAAIADSLTLPVLPVATSPSAGQSAEAKAR